MARLSSSFADFSTLRRVSLDEKSAVWIEFSSLTINASQGLWRRQMSGPKASANRVLLQLPRSAFLIC